MLKDLVRNKTNAFENSLTKDEFADTTQKGVSQVCLQTSQVTEEEVAEYIVENPKEVVVKFPIISGIKLDKKLPFFRSICFKLGGI